MEETNQSNEKNEMILTVILVGDTSTGKTNILSKFWRTLKSNNSSWT